MDETRASLFNKFREEVDTHLLRLSQSIVALEQDPANNGLLKEVFRSAHTIKGAAKMMGFAAIVRVTHEMESVLGAMRDGELHLTGDISDLLFDGIDAITVLTQLQASPEDSRAAQALVEVDLDQLVQRLQAIANTPARVDSPAPRVDGAALQHHLARPELPALKLDDDSVRVRIQKLDTLMHLSGEMMITKMQHQAITDRIQGMLETERLRARRLDELVSSVERGWGGINQADMEAALGQVRQLASQIDDMTAHLLRDFQDYASRLSAVANELEDTVLSVRMLPIDTLFSTFPRAVRDFKRETGKEVDLQMRGGETEIDKQILEALGDPLIHLLRNALDHGIERPSERAAAGKPPTGRVSLHAYQQGTQVVIEVADDGAGMDPAVLRRVAVQKNFLDLREAEKLSDAEILNLVFYPGFTTASIITDVSGRGVGMDVVKNTVEARLSGTASIDSTHGVGTRVTLRLPLTLATMKALLVRLGSQVYVLPSHTVEGGMDYIGPEDILLVQNHEMVRLKGRTMPLLRLDEMLDLGQVDSGAWLRDAGLPISDGRRAADDGLGLGEDARHPARTGRQPSAASGMSAGVRPPSAAQSRNGAADEDSLEHEVYEAFRAPALGTGVRLANKLPGVVVGSGDRQTCFLVDELIDELDVVVKNLGPLLVDVSTAIGATILGDGRVVIILDVPSLLAEARNRSSRGRLSRAWRPSAAVRRPRILVVDDSITTRELEKSILENAGYDVDIAMDGLEALSKLEQQRPEGEGRYDLAVVDIEMPQMDGLDLTQHIKTHPDSALRALPVIIVSSLASEAYKQRGIEVGAQAYITKGQFDQSNLLRTIDLLIHQP